MPLYLKGRDWKPRGFVEKPISTPWIKSAVRRDLFIDLGPITPNSVRSGMKLAICVAPMELGGLGDGFTINMSRLAALPRFSASFSTMLSGFQLL